MTVRIFASLLLAFICLNLQSAYSQDTLPDWVDYKDLGKDWYYALKSSRKGCVDIYYQKSTKKKLHGKYKLTFGVDGYGIGDRNYEYFGEFKRGKRAGMYWEFLNGNLQVQITYENGLKHGHALKQDGERQSRSVYVKGIKQGWEKEYDFGRLVREVNFEKGIKTGVEKFYNQAGELCADVTYGLKPDYNLPEKELAMKNIWVKSEFDNGKDKEISSSLLYFPCKGKIVVSGGTTTAARAGCHFHINSLDLAETVVMGGKKDCKAGSTPFFYFIQSSSGSFDTIEPTQWWVLISDDYSRFLELRELSGDVKVLDTVKE